MFQEMWSSSGKPCLTDMYSIQSNPLTKYGLDNGHKTKGNLKEGILKLQLLQIVISFTFIPYHILSCCSFSNMLTKVKNKNFSGCSLVFFLYQIRTIPEKKCMVGWKAVFVSTRHPDNCN